MIMPAVWAELRYHDTGAEAARPCNERGDGGHDGRIRVSRDTIERARHRVRDRHPTGALARCSTTKSRRSRKVNSDSRLASLVRTVVGNRRRVSQRAVNGRRVG